MTSFDQMGRSPNRAASAQRALRLMQAAATFQASARNLQQAKRAEHAYALIGELRRRAALDPEIASAIVTALRASALLAHGLLSRRRSDRTLSQHRYASPKAATDAELLAVVAVSCSLKDAARRLGMHRSTVTRRLRKMSHSDQSATSAVAVSTHQAVARVPRRVRRSAIP